METTNEMQVKQLIEKWVTAVHNHDVIELLKYYDDKIVMFDVPFSPQSKGPDELKRTWEFYFSLSQKVCFEIMNLGVGADDSIACCYGFMRCYRGFNDGTKEDLTFRLTVCLIKKDNQWLICHEHHSLIPECVN